MSIKIFIINGTDSFVIIMMIQQGPLDEPKKGYLESTFWVLKELKKKLIELYFFEF